MHGDHRGCVPGTALPVPHSAFQVQELGRQHPARLLESRGMAGGLWGAVTAGGQKGWFASWKGEFHCSQCPLFLLGFAAEIEEWGGEGLW